MKKVIIGTIALTAGLLFTGCESAPKEESAPKVDRAPECGSSDIKKIIINGFNLSVRASARKDLDNTKKRLDELKKSMDDETLKSWHNTIAKQEAWLKHEPNFTLKKILTENADDRIQKSICTAELHGTHVNGDHYVWDIDYTLQNTSDGELIVKMKKTPDYRIDWIWRVKSVNGKMI